MPSPRHCDARSPLRHRLPASPSDAVRAPGRVLGLTRALPRMSAPTGDRDQYAGDSTAVFAPSLTADYRRGRWFRGPRGGEAFRPTCRCKGQNVGPQGTGGARHRLRPPPPRKAPSASWSKRRHAPHLREEVRPERAGRHRRVLDLDDDASVGVDDLGPLRPYRQRRREHHPLRWRLHRLRRRRPSRSHASVSSWALRYAPTGIRTTAHPPSERRRLQRSASEARPIAARMTPTRPTASRTTTAVRTKTPTKTGSTIATIVAPSSRRISWALTNGCPEGAPPPTTPNQRRPPRHERRRTNNSP